MDALPTLAANASHGGNGSEHGLPDALLDTLSPLLGLQLNPLIKLFALLHKIIDRHLGIDPTYVLFVWAAIKVIKQLYTTMHTLFREHFTASIEISDGNDYYLHVMLFLATLRETAESRSLIAETPSKGAWDEEDDSDLATTPDGYLNFSHQETKALPRFTPARGVHDFRFKGRTFCVERNRHSLFNPAAGAEGMPQYKEETLVLSCSGRSPEPIKQLLQHAKEMYCRDHGTKTIVRRPSQRGPLFRSGSFWQQAAMRPVRPLKTVVLDHQLIEQILSDMNEYLRPSTSKWYADRGIPLRRGYLFHGPPGTGKSSFSFVIAGVFGLDIYVVSLLERKLTEETLLALFITLPRRCVVLFEDIDIAGVKRPSDDENEQDEEKASDLARQLKRHGNSDGSGGGISLAGLLNAIDGVATHEGRLLIMTTNKPEALDRALLRPGRVDQQVEFFNATSGQAEELFMHMYGSNGSATPGLRELALQFSSHIPSGMFSPAQLQGYLLTHKNMRRCLSSLG
ncbi:BCS1 N terminal-domain-containing protein [Staphylotrichum tortipilum]|uniref:BCS1 N terminal-domain-containing protein n=1 Tax=Staphylotrichum tortipilum TaxID=2831512 RepID=A0AAN6MBI1_9PEZI|nr:BCS1 N terminal-domain-containing protein [Staphylotrichum longicolle]